jgi:hypothetical protein
MCLTTFVFLLNDRKRRPEGGGAKWEPIKIPHSNLAYINQLDTPLF